MELTKKTTILFTPDLYRRLKRVANERGTSLGELVRRACASQYGLYSDEERLRAVDALEALSLPIGTTSAMKSESVPEPDRILPENASY